MIRVARPRPPLVALLTCLAVTACHSPREAPASASLVRVLAPTHHFTAVSQGAAVMHTFTLFNESQQPTSVSVLRASANLHVLLQGAWELPAGGKAELEVRLTTDEESGPIRRELRLLARCGDATQELLLGLEGQVRPLVSVTPDPLHFGEVELGKSPSILVEISAAADQRPTSMSAIVEDPRFVFEPTSDLAAGPVRGSLRLLPQSERCDLEATLLVTLEGAAVTTIRRGVRASVRGELRHAENLFFERRSGTFAPREIPVTSRHGRSVVLALATDPTGLLRLHIVEPETPHALLRAEVVDPRRRYEPPVHGHIQITTSSQAEPSLRIDYVIGEESEGASRFALLHPLR